MTCSGGLRQEEHLEESREAEALGRRTRRPRPRGGPRIRKGGGSLELHLTIAQSKACPERYNPFFLQTGKKKPTKQPTKNKQTKPTTQMLTWPDLEQSVIPAGSQAREVGPVQNCSRSRDYMA